MPPRSPAASTRNWASTLPRAPAATRLKSVVAAAGGGVQYVVFVLPICLARDPQLLLFPRALIRHPPSPQLCSRARQRQLDAWLDFTWGEFLFLVGIVAIYLGRFLWFAFTFPYWSKGYFNSGPSAFCRLELLGCFPFVFCCHLVPVGITTPTKGTSRHVYHARLEKKGPLPTPPPTLHPPPLRRSCPVPARRWRDELPDPRLHSVPDCPQLDFPAAAGHLL